MKALLFSLFLGLVVCQASAQSHTESSILTHLISVEKLPISKKDVRMTSDPCEFIQVYEWSGPEGGGHIVIRSLGCYTLEMMGFVGDEHGMIGSVVRRNEYQDMLEEAYGFLSYLVPLAQSDFETFSMKLVFTHQGKNSAPSKNLNNWKFAALMKK